MSFSRIDTPELLTVDSDLLPHLARPIGGDLHWLYEYMKAPRLGPYAHIADVLTESALASLQELPITENGKCPTEALLDHPVGGPLVRTMGRISLMNRYNPLDPDRIISSLKNETGVDISLAPHRDFLDGHAVLFNYGIVGKLQYVINGRFIPIDNNELVILNGSAEYISVDGLTVDSDVRFGGATPVHGVIGEGYTSRTRLLVYADGIPTTDCQIAA